MPLLTPASLAFNVALAFLEKGFDRGDDADPGAPDVRGPGRGAVLRRFRSESLEESPADRT